MQYCWQTCKSKRYLTMLIQHGTSQSLLQVLHFSSSKHVETPLPCLVPPHHLCSLMGRSWPSPAAAQRHNTSIHQHHDHMIHDHNTSSPHRSSPLLSISTSLDSHWLVTVTKLCRGSTWRGSCSARGASPLHSAPPPRYHTPARHSVVIIRLHSTPCNTQH